MGAVPLCAPHKTEELWRDRVNRADAPGFSTIKPLHELRNRRTVRAAKVGNFSFTDVFLFKIF